MDHFPPSTLIGESKSLSVIIAGKSPVGNSSRRKHPAFG
jgi:hypothetical protein